MKPHFTGKTEQILQTTYCPEYRTRQGFVRHGRGRMVVDLREFFPATSGRLKKLLDIVNQDILAPDEKRRQMYEFCIEWADEIKAAMPGYANKTVEMRTRCKEMEPEIEKLSARVNAMKVTGRRLSKDEKAYLKDLKNALKEAKGRQRFYQADARSYEADFNRMDSCVKRLLQNAEIINDQLI